MIRYLYSILLLTLCLVACNNPYDAEKVAEGYCNCMKSNDAIKDFEKASQICDKQLVKENRYVKLWSVDMNDRELDKRISDETRDSVKNFVSSFTNYTKAHCCKETLACP